VVTIEYTKKKNSLILLVVFLVNGG